MKRKTEISTVVILQSDGISKIMRQAAVRFLGIGHSTGPMKLYHDHLLHATFWLYE